jgi:nucleoside-diphosphate-sugar epimerase
VKVAVAGATGVLGRALVPKLIAAGHTPVLVVRNAAKARELFRGQPVDIAECDLIASATNEHTVAKLIGGCEGVIHIATAIPSDFSAPGAWTNNSLVRIRGTGRIERAALEVGAEVFLCQSIIMAYPDGGDEWLNEQRDIDESPERRDTCHAVGIMEAMVWLLRKHPRQMRWSILKGGIFVGPGTFQDRTVEQIRRGELVVPGDGSHFISPVHVEDVADAYVLALERAPRQSVFNICADPIRYGDYVDGLADRIGAPHPCRDPLLPKPPSHRATTAAARETLDWSPHHSIWPADEVALMTEQFTDSHGEVQ